MDVMMMDMMHGTVGESAAKTEGFTMWDDGKKKV